MDHSLRCNWRIKIWDPYDMAAEVESYVIENRTEQQAEDEAWSDLNATPQYKGYDFSMTKED